MHKSCCCCYCCCICSNRSQLLTPIWPQFPVTHTHTHTHSHTRTHMCRIEGSVCNGFVCCAALLLHLIKTLKCRRTIAVRVATVHSVARDAGRERDRDRDRDRGTSEGKLCVCACVGQIGKPTTK